MKVKRIRSTCRGPVSGNTDAAEEKECPICGTMNVADAANCMACDYDFTK